MTSPDGYLDVTRVDHVLLLTIRRGTKRNAITQKIAEQIDAAIERLETDPSLLVGVLTGETPCFSAGTDLSSERGPSTPRGGEYGFVRRQRAKPLVAAVEGWALGGGFEMALACDLVVAGRGASFGLPEVQRGLVANCGALFRGPEKLPLGVAVELLLTGDPLSAERAFSLGLVSRVTDDGEAASMALELALRIATNSPTAVQATLRAIAAARTDAESRLWPLTEAASEEARQSPDRAEGIAAFFERRPPRWSANA